MAINVALLTIRSFGIVGSLGMIVNLYPINLLGSTGGSVGHQTNSVATSGFESPISVHREKPRAKNDARADIPMASRIDRVTL
jgi:hypothetical protein